MKIKRRNSNALKKIIQAIDSLNCKIEAGWVHPGEKHQKTKLTMSQLAKVQEYGARTKRFRIPPRPMLRNTVILHSAEWIKQTSGLSKRVLENKLSPNQAIEMLASTVSEDIKATMENSKLYPPNRPSTIRKKGFNKPLIDTRDLLNAVDYKITRGH